MSDAKLNEMRVTLTQAMVRAAAIKCIAEEIMGDDPLDTIRTLADEALGDMTRVYMWMRGEADRGGDGA